MTFVVFAVLFASCVWASGCKGESASESGGSSSEASGEGAVEVEPVGETLGEQCRTMATEVEAYCADPPLGQEKLCVTWMQALDGYRQAPEASESACEASLPRVREAVSAGGGASAPPPGQPSGEADDGTLDEGADDAGVGGNAVMAEPHGADHVLPGARGERASEDADTRVRRVLSITNNYLMAHAAEHGAPADVDAARSVLESASGMKWPNDPWGQAFLYERVDAKRFTLGSSGPDGTAGTADDIRVTE